MKRIGIDIGNVIIGSDTDQPDLMFSDRYLEAPEMAGAFEAIARLVELYTPDCVFLVSKCFPKMQQKSSHCLQAKDFFGQTGVDPGNVHFCLHRPEKAEICVRLGLTAFVDDRYTVLKHLEPLAYIEDLILFAPGKSELSEL
jgi:hypothetical protein